LDALTSSSRSARRANPRAGWSLVCGLFSVAVIPIGIVLARESEAVTLVNASGSAAVAILFGFSAILLARRARTQIEITLGRARGGQAARAGRLLGLLGVLLGATAALALGFYGLLTLFAG
jgi:hypothetical protein